MKAWTVEGRRVRTAACARASAAASPVNPASNCMAGVRLERQLRKRPAFALGHLEAENARDRRGDVGGADGPLGAGAPGHPGAPRHEPDPPAGVVAAAVVGESVAGDVAVTPQL